MHIVDGLELAAAFAGLAEQLRRAVWPMSARSTARTRSGAGPMPPSVSEARVILPAPSTRERRRRRRWRNRRGAARTRRRHSHAPPARAGSARRSAPRRLDRRRHIARGKSREGDLALPFAARRQSRLASSAAATQDQFGRRIEMAQRAADRAAVARLAMADVADRLVHQRDSVLRLRSENSRSRWRVIAPISSRPPSRGCRRARRRG